MTNMRNFWIVFKYEVKTLLSRKVVVLIPLLLGLALFGLTFVPRFFSQPTVGSQGEKETMPSENEDRNLDFLDGVVLGTSDPEVEMLLDQLGVKKDVLVHNENDLVDQMTQSDSYHEGIWLEGLASYRVYSRSVSDRFSSASDFFHDFLLSAQKDKLYKELSLKPDQIKALDHISVESETKFVSSGSNDGGIGRYVFAFGSLIFMYMLILMYGSTTATGVAREKDNRTMELLITSTRIAPMILGKVLASALVALCQLTVMASLGLLGLLINRSVLPTNLLPVLSFNLPLQAIVAYIYFYLIGYLMYLFLFAAIGSTVTKMEDVQGSVSIVTLLFVAAYMLAMNVLQDPSSVIGRIGSLIPFTSILVMPIRTLLGVVMWPELLLSMGLVLVTLILLFWMSVKIYRWGSLNYGQKFNLKTFVLSLMSKE